jgi:exonuclease III
MSLKTPRLRISAINCNSMNVSTLGLKNSRTYLKVEGITGKKPDIILMSDLRLKDKSDEIKRIMGLTRYGSYKLYTNSSRESRGVGIAIKRNIKQEVLNTYIGEGDENCLLLDIKIKENRLTLGVIYGPNSTNVEFFNSIERKIKLWGNKCIIGGDFNMVINQVIGPDNLDRDGEGRIPNAQNSKVINRWIDENFLIDPFRVLYPEQKEISFLSFRRESQGNIGGGVQKRLNKARLDFFLLSPDIIDWVGSVKYEDRLGSDFDHKEVMMQLGMVKRSGKITIRDDILEDSTVDDISCWTIYDSIVNHLAERDEVVVNTLAQLKILIDGKEILAKRETLFGRTTEIIELQEMNSENILLVKNRLPDMTELLDRGLTCDYRILYEVILMGVKTNLVEFQGRVKEREAAKREDLLRREDYMARTFGENSQQRYEASEAILRFDDILLRNRATTDH